MTEVKRLSKESFNYIVGEGVSKALNFLLLPIYAWYLSLDDFAVLSTVNILWPLIIIFLGQGFSAYIMRGYYDFEDRSAFLGTILLFSGGVSAVMALIIHQFGPFVFGSMFENMTYSPYLQYAVFFAVFRVYFLHVVSIYRGKRQAKTSVVLSFILFASNLVAVLVAVFIVETDLLGIFRAQVIAFVFVAIVYTVRVLPEISFSWRRDVIASSLPFVLPLLAHSMAGWSANHVSRVFVERIGLTQLSIFSAAMQLALVLSVLVNGLNQAWAPFVYANYEKQDFKELFVQGARKALLLVLLIATAVVLGSYEVLLLLGKSEYLQAMTLIPMLVVAYVFQLVYQFFVALLIYNKRTGTLPRITIMSGLTAIVLNYLLVPLLGMYGAAISTVAAFVLIAVMARSATRRYLRVTLLTTRITSVILLAAALSLLAVFWVDELEFALRVTVKGSLLLLLVLTMIRLGLLNLRNLRDLLPGRVLG